MVAYSSDMAISVISGRLRSIGLGQFLAELARCVADSVSMIEDRRGGSPDAAEFEDVRQSRQGDSDAYRRLIERHQEHVSGILWRFSRDRIVHEELVQDVFVEAYMSLRSYRGTAPFEHWLSRIATRVGYRYWKQAARRRETENFTIEEWDQVAEGSQEQMDPSEAASLVHRLLAQLPPRDRLVLTLRYLEECDVAETARRMGWTQGMVKVQALRAKKKLEKLIAKAERGLE